jgi:rhodanese-related sulfurtransferase
MIAEISIAELEPHVASGSLVIDVRETDEFVAGHVPNAVSIPLSPANRPIPA